MRRRCARLLRWLLILGGLPWGPLVLSQAPPGPLTPAEARFLEAHWRRPLVPQGAPPASFTPLERSLRPGSCGTCHPAQWADWKTTIHARSMGPGVAAQLVEMVRQDPASAQECLPCHAPLAEQAPTASRSNGHQSSPTFDAALQTQGLVCAACHVRKHERFGPPRRDGSLSVSTPTSGLPHAGVTRTSAFTRSEFCSSCHQFAANGLALNGKLLENTYEEWKASPAAQGGLQCQDCHMPDRRHLWRGIHDPEMVRQGVEITLTTDQARHRPGDQVQAVLTITASRVGHFFPTYVTPRVVARAELVDADGHPIGATKEERSIGRDLPPDLSREVADTRIPPGGRFRFAYRRRLDRPGLQLRVTVTVFPDHFYVGVFEALLRTGAGAGTAELHRALAAARGSAFCIFNREVPLT